MIRSITFVILFCFCSVGLAQESPRLRIFILAGQSNMEGKGAIQHLESLLAGDQAEQYKKLKNDSGWVERDDVSIKFFEKHGPLTVGYGKPDNRIGPEYGFGQRVGDRFDEHVLLIKTAWGGRSLAVDFRPPSSGPGQFKTRDRKTKELVPLPEEKYGATYREMMQEIRETLDQIEKYVTPGASENGYELSGFVWFQGFNDIINAEFSAEYEQNLINFIEDVRNDLGVDDLPFIIGELGQQGTQPEKRYAEKHHRFRAKQSSVAQRPEFKKTVAFVKTSPYVIKDRESFDGGYHYFGRADTFYKIGDAFAKESLLMCRDTPRDHSK